MKTEPRQVKMPFGSMKDTQTVFPSATSRELKGGKAALKAALRSGGLLLVPFSFCPGEQRVLCLKGRVDTLFTGVKLPAACHQSVHMK